MFKGHAEINQEQAMAILNVDLLQEASDGTNEGLVIRKKSNTHKRATTTQSSHQCPVEITLSENILWLISEEEIAQAKHCVRRSHVRKWN